MALLIGIITRMSVYYVRPVGQCSSGIDLSSLLGPKGRGAIGVRNELGIAVSFPKGV